NGLGMLAAVLASDDQDEFDAGLRTARLLKPSSLATTAALDAMKRASPSRSALLVTLLGDLGNPAGLPPVVKAVKSDDKAVRIAALAALAPLGNADHVELLVDAALDKSEDVSAVAQKTLAVLKGDDVDSAVLGLLNDEARQAMAIRTIGQRRISTAVPQLLPLLEGPKQLEVVAALGETVSLNDIGVLGELLGHDSAQLRGAARKAVHAACYRMTDRDATASKLATYLDDASEETVDFVMDELRIVGGDQALATVSNAVGGSDATRKDYATRALGQWLDTSAAPVLLDLAKDEGGGKFGIRGMRGYIRLARQFSMPDAQRLAMCRTALAVATRTAEKKLVLAVLARYPSAEMLDLAITTSKEPSLKGDAATAALAIAEKTDVAVDQAFMARLGLAPVKLQITKAEYGAGSRLKNVTAILRRSARGYPLIVLQSPSYSESFRGDPAPGSPKQLKIQFRIDGKPNEASFDEDAAILLPIPE
ncbi:MAG: hypothetical protein CMJ50_05260, partial [Planctomycetaceae bacterium]|nr:hypothetical protein [Planctomycetaceae bacterium]